GPHDHHETSGHRADGDEPVFTVVHPIVRRGGVPTRKHPRRRREIQPPMTQGQIPLSGVEGDFRSINVVTIIGGVNRRSSSSEHGFVVPREGGRVWITPGIVWRGNPLAVEGVVETAVLVFLADAAADLEIEAWRDGDIAGVEQTVDV